MKNLYPKNKGKVYPSPSAAAAAAAAGVAVNPSSSSSSLAPGPNRDVFTVLNLLPTAIIALVSILSLQDREVLAYLITRSMKTTIPFSILDEEKKKNNKNRCNNNKKSNNNNYSTTSTHKPPIFDCGCFDCYTSYWFRWDSSPNRELIHQAIEAFEEHLTNGELYYSSSSKKKNGGKGGKKKDKTPTTTTTTVCRGNTKTEEEESEKKKSSFVLVLLPTPTEAPKELNKADDFLVGASDFKSDDMGNEQQVQQQKNQLDEVVSGELKQTVEEEEEEEAVQLPASINRGLVRKVLPDVLGLFNSRLWSLWNPTV